jgi:hypothetical protein
LKEAKTKKRINCAVLLAKIRAIGVVEPYDPAEKSADCEHEKRGWNEDETAKTHHFLKSEIACRSALGLDLHPAGLEPVTL